MMFEVSFTFSFQNPFLSKKMKVKGFQIRLVGVRCTSPEKKNAKETWVEIQEGKDILKYPPVTRSRLGGK